MIKPTTHIKFLNENYFKNKKEGYFVDIGANDGINASNTHYLEKLGWNGICFEPIPDIFKILKKHRKCELHNMAITEENKKYNFLHLKAPRKTGIYPDMLSGIMEYYTQGRLERINKAVKKFKGEKIFIEVEGIKFNDIVEETTIDLISLDVEGSEFNIIKSIDFNVYNIHSFIIENNPEGKVIIEQDQELIDFMISKGYELVKTISADNIFVKNNFKKLKPAINYLL